MHSASTPSTGAMRTAASDHALKERPVIRAKRDDGDEERARYIPYRGSTEGRVTGRSAWNEVVGGQRASDGSAGESSEHLLKEGCRPPDRPHLDVLVVAVGDGSLLVGQHARAEDHGGRLVREI